MNRFDLMTIYKKATQWVPLRIPKSNGLQEILSEPEVPDDMSTRKIEMWELQSNPSHVGKDKLK